MLTSNLVPGQRTPSDSASRQVPRQSKTGNRARVFCRVVLDGMQSAKKFIEMSLEHFHPDGKPLAGRSIILLDKKTETLFQQVSTCSKSLYDRLSDMGMTFVRVDNKDHSGDIHEFIRKNFESDNLQDFMDLIKKIPLPPGQKGFNYSHVRSLVYQLVCPAFAYSLDKTIDSVAVIDADSFAPALLP